MSDVFNGNARDLTDFGEVRTLIKTTPVRAVELSVAVEVETAEGVKYEAQPGDWLLEAEDGRRWTTDAAYIAASYRSADGGELAESDLAPLTQPPADEVVESEGTPTTAEDEAAFQAAQASTGVVTSSTLTEGAQ